ncbi:MAG: hypothetical protein LBL46_03595 [Rickettsiales bacterium]|jgi:hypothetical protein|nr:hypothetical protein [Rickettsiales bacterium]
MKKLLIFILSAGVAGPATADGAASEIKARYDGSYAEARAVCAGISAKIDGIKIMAGVGIGAGAVGTIGGAVATIAGILKYSRDKIALKKPTGEEISAAGSELASASKSPVDLTAPAGAAPGKSYDKKSVMLGNVRTIGAGVAGAGGAAGAITSFMGAGKFDELISDINACGAHIVEMERRKTELSFAAPDDPALPGMEKIIAGCKGMSGKNIADVKGRMTAAGILSAVGGAAGIAGAITSAVAVSKEKRGADAMTDTKGLNMAANISSGVAAAGNLGGTILSGVVLAGLNRNGDIAKNCAELF